MALSNSYDFSLTARQVIVYALQKLNVLPLTPVRIRSTPYRDPSSNVLPMRLFTRQEYFALPTKTSAGTPTQYYFDPQRGAPTLYVWPVKATVTTETFKVTYHKRTDDLDDLANDIDIPQEALETI